MTAVFVMTPDVAVIVTLTALLTEVATASNPVDLAPADTVTADGTFKVALLLFSFTTVAFVASAVRYTEQPFDCAPVSDCVPHETRLRLIVELLLPEPLVVAPEPLNISPPHPDSAVMAKPEIAVSAKGFDARRTKFIPESLERLEIQRTDGY